MRLQNMLPYRAALPLGLLAVMTRAQSSGLLQQYCSPQNTGSQYQGGAGVYNMYQSNGACSTLCQGSYAFAVVQDNLCWCSNYIPANQVSVSRCDDVCPGYGSERCGNLNAGLFGYVALSIQPSGTAGATTSTTSTTSLRSTSSPASTPSQQQQMSTVETAVIVQTVTKNEGATTVVSYVTLVSSTSTSTTSPSSSTSTSATAVVSQIVVTVSGAVVTQTVTSTPIGGTAQDSSSLQVQQQGLSNGAIAGIVIGVVAAVLAVVLAAFLLWRRRDKRRAEKASVTTKAAAGTAAAGGVAGAGEKGPVKRNTSVLSRSGLLARVQNEQHENPFDEPNGGTASQRQSMLFGAGAAVGGVSPVSPLEQSYSNESRRHSKPLVYDQRLNPSALFGVHDNSSRVSMQDGADYSRTLGVTNPDPRASWESRISRG